MVSTTSGRIGDQERPIPEAEFRRIQVRLDLNPGFPTAAGRTPLAKVRTCLSVQRSQMASTRAAPARRSCGAPGARSRR